MVASVSPGSRRAAVVFHPLKVDAARLKSAVRAAEQEYGWASSLWLETTPEDSGARQTATALEHGVDVVIAAGGDGTVRAVASSLRGTDTALAIVPAGTGNLLARNLALDLNITHLKASVEVAFSGVERDIDVGLVTITRANGDEFDHTFLVMAGLGLDAKMIANTNPELKKRVGWLAYVDAIGRSLLDKEVVRGRYRLDKGEERSLRVHTILVGNCGLLPGNVILLPEAVVDDGKFEIVTLRPEGFGGWAQISFKIFWENGVLRRSSVGRKIVARSREVRTLRYLRGTDLTVSLEREQEFELDGDEFGKITGFHASVDAGSLAVRVPA